MTACLTTLDKPDGTSNYGGDLRPHRHLCLHSGGDLIITCLGYVTLVKFLVLPFTLIYFHLATIINLIIAINVTRLLCRALQTYK